MSAAENIVYTIEELAKAIDEQWREKIRLQDLDEKMIIAEDGNSIIGLASDADPTLLLDLALNKGLKHICQFSNLHLERELNTSASMLLTPEKFIEFPLSTVLAPTLMSEEKEKDLTGFSMEFSKASEKVNVLSQLEAFLRNHIRAESLIDDIKSIADELFTNAVFNAPFVNLKSGAVVEKDRTDITVEMPEDKTAMLFAGTVDKQLVIGCRDPFGTLKLDKLLQRILNCYQSGVAESMHMDGIGGAGIGSYMVYNTAASYYVGVKEGEATIVCCSLPINMSSRKRGQIAKNMHFFELKGGQK